MTRRIFFFAAVVVLVLAALPAGAKKKKDPFAGLTPAEEAGLRLLALQSKGYIDLHIGEPSTFILVEPKAWAAMTHHDKRKLCRLALSFCRGLNREGKNILYIHLKNMTTWNSLARVWVESGQIEIFK